MSMFILNLILLLECLFKWILLNLIPFSVHQAGPCWHIWATTWSSRPQFSLSAATTFLHVSANFPFQLPEELVILHTEKNYAKPPIYIAQSRLKWRHRSRSHICGEPTQICAKGRTLRKMMEKMVPLFGQLGGALMFVINKVLCDIPLCQVTLTKNLFNLPYFLDCTSLQTRNRISQNMKRKNNISHTGL